MSEATSTTHSLSVYLDRRILRIFIIGFISGFPWVLHASVLTVWLQDYGLSRTTIGFAGAILFVYAVNFLWAPLVDRISIPWLSKKLGRRRGLIVTLQVLILLALICWYGFDPNMDLFAIVVVGVVIATSSATMDIEIDALRIEQVGKDEPALMAAGAAATLVGWWTAFKLGGGVALTLAEYFESIGIQYYWNVTFLVLGVVIVLSTVALVFIVKEDSWVGVSPDLGKRQADVAARVGVSGVGTAIGWLWTVGEPLASFFRRNGLTVALSLLGFVFLFKIGEAFLGRMSMVFYKEIGFSNTDIAIYSKGLGWVITVLFTVFGSLIAVRAGAVKALVFAGLAMASTNILFAMLAWVGKSSLLFAIAVIADDITTAMANVTFVAFISLLVDRTYTAPQYALLASLGTASRTLLGSSSGWAVDALGGDWGTFFVITAIMVTPSLCCLWILRHRIDEVIAGKVLTFRGG